MKSAGGKPRHHGLGGNIVKSRQRISAHRQRKVTSIRKEAARYKDGKGKARAHAAKKIANGFA
jgi:hypothetical protein